MIKAPYNFVPLAQTVVFPDWADKISMDIPFKDGISGTIDVSYTAKTPVFIGNGKEKGPDGKETSLVLNYKSANGEYALPGSSLRGMLRNVIEIASFGKFSNMDDSVLSYRELNNKYLYREKIAPNGKNMVKTGWLVYDHESNEWYLYPVNSHRVEDSDLEKIYHTEESLKKRAQPEERRKTLGNNPVVYFEARSSNNIGSKAFNVRQKSFTNAIKGYTILTGHPGGKKHMDFIFEEINSNQIKIDIAVIKAFEDSNRPEANKQKMGKSLSDILRKIEKGEKADKYPHNYPGIPVFYLSENGKPVSLGLTQMYRLPYKYTLKDAAGHSSPAHNEELKMDFAECVFGRIFNDGNKDYSLRGRVQFEDAVSKNAQLDEMVETVLGNPNPSYYPAYIEQKEGSGKYSTLMDPKVRLRGWKRYPVREKTNEIPVGKDQDSVRTQFYPMKDGSIFDGKIHFHNLKPQELGALLWSITWNNQKNLSHSIGMGKSYGFGQIKAEIKNFSFLENSSDGNIYTKATDVKISDWQNDFNEYMKSNVSNWEASNQLKELFAMANPENANRSNWKLAHMSLDNKEFSEVKNRSTYEFLAPYSNTNQGLKLGGNDFSGNNSYRNGKVASEDLHKSYGIKNKQLFENQEYDAQVKLPRKEGKKLRATVSGINEPITLDKKELPGKKEGDSIRIKIEKINRDPNTNQITGYEAKIL